MSSKQPLVQTLVRATRSRRATIRVDCSSFKQRRSRKHRCWFETLLPPHNHVLVVLCSTPLVVGVVGSALLDLTYARSILLIASLLNMLCSSSSLLDLLRSSLSSLLNLLVRRHQLCIYFGRHPCSAYHRCSIRWCYCSVRRCCYSFERHCCFFHHKC